MNVIDRLQYPRNWKLKLSFDDWSFCKLNVVNDFNKWHIISLNDIINGFKWYNKWLHKQIK